MTNWEIAQIKVKPGHGQQFEGALSEGVPILQSFDGCHAVALHRGVDVEDCYMLLIEWDSVEHHLGAFVGSEPARALSALLAPHIAAKPVAIHSDLTGIGFAADGEPSDVSGGGSR